MDHHDIIERLCEAGFSSYICGGAVRDMFDGKIPNDYDIVTQATPDQIEMIFPTEKVDMVGKSFGVTIINGYEIATFRTDHYPTGNGAKNCVPVFAQNIHQDISRRDFTVNALALCPLSGDLIDDHSGREDLKNRIIRFVGNPDDRINEDPNRIIRACRFVAKLEGTFDINTLFALRRNVWLLSKVDGERIMIEIKKAMELETPSIFFSALYIIGALEYIFPGMERCVMHTHGNHHMETVWDHMMLSGDSVSPKYPIVRLAAFLHDIGKPFSYDPEDGTFIDHENLGADIVNRWLGKLKFSNQDRNNIVNLIRLHMRGSSKDSSARAVRRFRKVLNDHNITPQDWLRLRIADRKGNVGKDDFTFTDIRERREMFIDTTEPLPFSVNDLALKGGELIEIFKLTPGPIVGKLQKHLLNWIIEEGQEHNNIKELRRVAENFLTPFENL